MSKIVIGLRAALAAFRLILCGLLSANWLNISQVFARPLLGRVLPVRFCLKRAHSRHSPCKPPRSAKPIRDHAFPLSPAQLCTVHGIPSLRTLREYLVDATDAPEIASSFLQRIGLATVGLTLPPDCTRQKLQPTKVAGSTDRDLRQAAQAISRLSTSGTCGRKLSMCRSSV